jgi:DNA polymerase-3 subunit delta
MDKQHAYKKFENDLKDDSIKNALLLYGKEQYLVKWAVETLSKKYVSDDHRAFDFYEVDHEKATVDAIVENCETLSMFSGKRIVYIPDFTLFSESKHKSIKEADEKLLAEYIKNVPDTCLLIMTSDSADKRKKIFKEIAMYGGVYDFEALDERALKNCVEKRFSKYGKKIRTSVVAEFVEQSGYFHKDSGYTLFNIENEIKKIAAHCDGGEVSVADVIEVISGDIENNLFAMIDAVGRNKKDESYRLLVNLLGSDGSVFHILALLVSQFELMLEVKEMKGEGKSSAEIQRVLNVNEYRIKKAASVAGLYSIARIRDILKKLFQVEINIKTGLMDQNLALEVMISEV